MEHRILHGDCRKILPTLKAKSVDMVFADPPYNLGVKYKLKRPDGSVVNSVTDEWDSFGSLKDYDKFTEEWLKECRRVMTDQSTIWVMGSYHNIYRVGRILMDMGFWILNNVQWHKTNPMPNFLGKRFTEATETLIWARKNKEQKEYVFNHHEMKGFNAGKQMTTLWSMPLCRGNERIQDENGNKAHSTQKPEALLKRVIIASSNEEDTVLDPFAGTGTTSAMAKLLNRKSISIEKEKKYIGIINKRLAICEVMF